MSHVIAANRSTTTLAGAINSTATSAVLAAGTGALFPNPGAGQFFTMSFTDAATGGNHEIVYVTSRTGDVISITRGQEGSAAQSWVAGDFAANQLTAGTLQFFVQLDDLESAAGQYAIDSGTADAVVIGLSPIPSSWSALIGAPLRILKGANPNSGGSITLEISGLSGTKAILRPDGSDPSVGELCGSGIFTIVYSGGFCAIQSISDLNPTSHGGTGRTTFTSGALLVGNGAGAVSELAPPLIVSYGGSGRSTLDQYAVLAGNLTAAMESISPSATADYPLCSNGSADWPNFRKLNLTTAVTGKLAVAFGGTNRDTLDQYAILAGNLAASVESISPSATADYPLCSNGAADWPNFRKLNLTTAVTGKLNLVNSPASVLVDGTSAPGAHTFTVPADTYWCCGLCVGGGGGGAAGNATYNGGGGGAGGTAGGPMMGWFAVMPFDVIAYTVGAGGTVGTAFGDGGDGGASSIGAVMSATGGQGGTSVAGSSGGFGGAGSGPSGVYSSVGGYGGDGTVTAGGVAGNGGVSSLGGGGKGHQVGIGGDGAAGAGGGGGYNSVDGSSGLPGIVLIWA